MATTARQTGKHPGGAPRTKTPKTWTKAQLDFIDEAALAQARDYTIAEALEIDVKTFKAEFSKRCSQKRAQGKLERLKDQNKMAKNNPTMSIWYGKQHLEQSDKQEHTHGVTDGVANLLREVNGTRHYPGAGESAQGEPE